MTDRKQIANATYQNIDASAVILLPPPPPDDAVAPGSGRPECSSLVLLDVFPSGEDVPVVLLCPQATPRYR